MNRETILKGKANFPKHFKDIKECGRKHLQMPPLGILKAVQIIFDTFFTLFRPPPSLHMLHFIVINNIILGFDSTCKELEKDYLLKPNFALRRDCLLPKELKLEF